MIDAESIRFVRDGFSMRIELAAGDVIVARTLEPNDMLALSEAFQRHASGLRLIAETDNGDPNVPRWKRRMAKRAAARKAGHRG